MAAGFELEFRACLAQVVGEEPPAADGDTVLLARHWLGERNLGLVPIEDPAGFAWPGEWIARVHGKDGDHAVLMFGSPSGPVFDPGAAAGGPIAEGWVVARLDLQLPGDRPYGTATSSGSVLGLLLAPAAEAALTRVDEAVAVAGRGLEGDRYGAGRGTFSGRGRGYELTLVEAEALDEVGLSWELARRNVVTRGVSLNALAGRPFRIGAVECVGRRLAEPCSHLEKLSGPGLLRPLVHRAGLRADIVSGGTIRVGDELVPLGDTAGQTEELWPADRF